MARRSDHSRPELRALILEQAHGHMAEVGYARFSAREVAKRIGYAVGTIYNVYGTLDGLIAEVNTRTFTLWADALERSLHKGPRDRIEVLVEGYFQFARTNRNLWLAIYEHHPDGFALDAAQHADRGRLTGIVAREISLRVGRAFEDVVPLTRSLIAAVHGHCAFEVTRTYEIMGADTALEDALARVRESLSLNTAEPESDR